MARRNSLTTDDFEVIEGALTEKITAMLEPVSGNLADGAVATVAPLFAVREKIIAMRSKPNGQADTPKIRKARTPRTNQPERAEA